MQNIFNVFTHESIISTLFELWVSAITALLLKASLLKLSMFEILRRLHQLSYAETVVWQRDLSSMNRDALVKHRQQLENRANRTKTLIDAQDLVNKIGAGAFLLASIVTGEPGPILGAVAILTTSAPFSYLMRLHYELTNERQGIVQDMLIGENYATH